MKKSFAQKQIVFGALSIALFFAVSSTSAEAPTLPFVDNEDLSENDKTEMLFVGDIMLGRVVENIIERNGFSYVLEGTDDLISNSDIVVGNFEGVVAKKHFKTPAFGYRFSIKEEYLQSLKNSGFTTFSLANNHASDYGEDSLTKTRDLCNSFDLLCLGDPSELNEFSYGTQEINEHTVGYLFLHTLFTEPDIPTIEKTITDLKNQTDFLVVYIHWGQEYELIHNKSQEDLAHTLIDLGADAVMGHHPHVVQDIEVYNGKPIFYSLGNFIFDQYFNNEVQEGLGVQVVLNKDIPTYNIFAFTSKYSVAQPRLMDYRETSVLFERISDKITQIGPAHGKLSL